MTKLTLAETTQLALKNHISLELIPGETTGGGFRFHCLISHPGTPNLAIVFGDEAHGYLFQTAKVNSTDGRYIRVTEDAVRNFLEAEASVPRWTREMPDAANPIVLGLTSVDPDRAVVGLAGIVVDAEKRLVQALDHYGRLNNTLTLVGSSELTDGDTVQTSGVYEFPYTVHETSQA